MNATKNKIVTELGVPFVGIVGENEAQEVMLGALCARELGERAIACGDEVILVGALYKAESAALCALGVTAVCVPADADAATLERALSPATKAVWVCADAACDTVRTVRNFCNAFDLWMMASLLAQDARRCIFEDKTYHVGAVADVAAGALEDVAFVCTKDELPDQLMRQRGAK